MKINNRECLAALVFFFNLIWGIAVLEVIVAQLFVPADFFKKIFLVYFVKEKEIVSLAVICLLNIL